MARLLVVVTVAVASVVIAILELAPSLGHAGDQPRADSVAEILVVDPLRALQADPTGPFRRAVVKAHLPEETVGAVGNAAAADSGGTSAVEVGTRGDRPKGGQANASSLASNEATMACTLESYYGGSPTDRHTFTPAPPATIPTPELPVHARRADAEGAAPPSDLPAESPRSQAIAGSGHARSEQTPCGLWLADPPCADAMNYEDLSESFLAWDKSQLQACFPDWYSDFKQDQAVTESDGRCALKAPALLPQPATGSTERAEPATLRYPPALAVTRQADPEVPAPSEPAKPGSGKAVPTTSSAAVVPGPPPPVVSSPVAVAPKVPGPYPQCSYLGCCDPLACRECVYCKEIQHYDYYPAMHGYYYFLPYNASNVPRQQAFSARSGGDPRAPYANGVFQTVYAAYRAAHPAPGSDTPATTPPEKIPSPEPTNPFQEAKGHLDPKRG